MGNFKGARAYRLAETGEQWPQIARLLGLRSKQAAQGRARTYARNAGVPWPIKRPTGEAPSRQQRCYDLRAQGLSWAEISLSVGYRGEASACTSARRHAEACGLVWPPEPPAERVGKFTLRICAYTKGRWYGQLFRRTGERPVWIGPLTRSQDEVRRAAQVAHSVLLVPHG